MLFPIFLVLLVGFGKTTSSLINNQELHHNSSVSSDGVQQAESSQNLLGSEANKNQQRDGKSMATDIITQAIIALLAREQHNITKSSNFPTLVATNISEQCHKDSVTYHQAYLLRVDWAKKMFESTGKLPEAWHGSGNLHGLGLFDECLSVGYWAEMPFHGQYCTVFFDSALVMPWELEETSPSKKTNSENNEMQRNNWVGILQGLELLYNGPRLKEPKVSNSDPNSKNLLALDYCIPSSCSAQDFRSSVAQLVGSRVIGNTTYDGNFYYTSMVTINDENYCYTTEKIHAPPKYNGADITVIVVLSLLGLVVLLATSHELWLHYQNRPVEPKKMVVKALHCFSMLTNGKKLLSTKSAAVDNLACLNGIRVLSTTWIVLYHTYYQAIINPMYNVFTLIEDALTWQLHSVLNATVSVDTFFLMSGLLVTYSLMRQLDRNKGRFNVGFFYLHRYLRLTPVYAVILGFIATLLAYLGSGPNWQNVRNHSLVCRSRWWTNLLYINNFLGADCMGETWYLACDMQMFILSPLFIYPLWRWRKIGLSWAIFNIVGILCGTIAIFVVWDLPAMSFFTRENDMNNPYYFYGYYASLWTRFPPYILGILLGWILHLTKNTQIKLKKVVVAVGWTLTIVIGLAVIYGMVPYLNEYEVPEMNDFVRVSYGSLHRIAWASCVAWIIFACIHGYGGYVNRFLSWKMFIPLGRLTYVVYLVHQNFLLVYHAYIRKPYYYTKFTHAEHYFGIILMVFLMAFAICLVVEVPLLNLEKLLVNPTRTKKPAAVDIDIEPAKRPNGEETETVRMDM